MRNIQLIVFSIIISFSMLAFARGTQVLLGAPTPLQSYQSANTPHVNNNSQGTVVNSQSVEKHSRAATIMVPLKKVGAVTNGSTKKLTLKSTSNSDIVHELESQMNTLNQATLLYQQETNQKIENLSTQNAALQEKLQKLTQAMVMMNQQLSAIGNTAQSALPPKSTKASTTVQHLASSELFKYVAFTLAALLAVLLGMLISLQKGKNS